MTRKHIALLFCVGVYCLMAVPLCAQDYGATMKKKVQSVLGAKDLKNYEWISYPTNNFGVMTMFIVDAKGQKIKPENQECATFTCLGLKPSDLNAEQLKDVDGYADIGEGGSITLNDDEKKALSLSAVLPKILSVLNLSGNVDRSTGITTTMSLGPATKRFLVKQKALDYIDKLPENSRVKSALTQGRLGIVIADVELNSMDVTLKIDKKLNAGLDAELSGKVNKVFGEGDKLSVQINNTGDGTYVLKVTQPVIVARLTATKPFGNARGGGFPAELAAWNRDWGVTTVEEATKP